MPGTNNFLPYATDPTAAVLSQSSWAAATPNIGRGAGIVPKEYFNKAHRQGNAMAAAIGQFIANAGFNALDDGNIPNLTAAFLAALESVFTGGGFTGVIGNPGWIKFPFGNLLLNWGTTHVGNYAPGATGTISFLEPFSSAVLFLQTGLTDVNGPGNGGIGTVGGTDSVDPLSHFDYVLNKDGSLVTNATINWLALGV